MNIINSIHRSPVRPLALVLILGLLGATTPALATEPASVTVSYRDLDLSSIAGAQTLYGRIKAAARRVCGYEGRNLTDQAFWNACYRGAIADAVTKVNNPLLTAVHTGRPVDSTVAMLGK
jgi:UrcA family protein